MKSNHKKTFDIKAKIYYTHTNLIFKKHKMNSHKLKFC